MPPPNASANSEPLDALPRALWWSIASVAWTVCGSTAAIVSGVAVGSLLLVVFGAVGLLDAVGSIVLIEHFRHALHHETISEERERRALLAIASGMAVIAVATTIESSHRLVSRNTGEFSAVGTAVAAASIVALAILGAGKLRIGARIDSRALVADGHVSMMGSVLAVCTCVGTIATSALDWWWLDPAASLVVAFVAVGVAASHLRAEPRSDVPT
jgi:divalent metal cation (Fe/Co/Zn/Cd) transporter